MVIPLRQLDELLPETNEIIKSIVEKCLLSAEDELKSIHPELSKEVDRVHIIQADIVNFCINRLYYNTPENDDLPDFIADCVERYYSDKNSELVPISDSFLVFSLIPETLDRFFNTTRELWAKISK